MVWSEEFFMAVALLPKIPALLSTVGSLLILHGVLNSPTKRKRPYHRLLAGMSLADLLSSLGYFWGTWAIPRGTPLVYGAIGNQQTCSAAGLVIVVGMPVTAMYNAGLAFYYMATVRYNWNERKIAQVERVFHAVFWSLGLAFGISGLFLKLYNSTANWLCWIEAKPLNCLDTFRHGKERGNCERGNNAFIFQWAFYFFFGWLSFVIMVSCLTSVYFAVLNIEQRRDSYRFPSPEGQQEDRSKSRRIFEQAVLYGLAFVATWIFQTLSRIQFFFTERYLPGFALLASFFIPMQGFWNFLIYRHRRGGDSASARSKFVRYLCCGLGGYNTSGNNTSGNNEHNSTGRSFRVDGQQQASSDTISATSTNEKVCHKQAIDNDVDGEETSKGMVKP